jgi:DNA-binding MarR family transcriptional regulator
VSTESVTGFALAPDGHEPGIDVARLRVALARLSRRLRRHEIAGLTPTQLAALATVGKEGPMRLGDLAAVEGIAPSTLTRLVTALEESGYVRRCADPSDARASMLAITPHGLEVLERIRSESTLVLAASLQLLTPEQRAALAAALPVLEQLAEAPGSTRSLPVVSPVVTDRYWSLPVVRRRASSSRSLVTSASWRSSSMMRRTACSVMPSSAMETTCWMMRIS